MTSVASSRGWNLFQWRAGAAAPPPALTIRSAGLCCAVGYNLAAATCAIQANMDHFQQSEFETPQRDKVLVARLDESGVWGPSRLARWIALAIADCLGQFEALDTAGMPLLWLAPEPTRSGTDTAWYAGVFRQAVEELGLRFHPASGILPLGRAGLAHALEQSGKLMEQTGCDQVLLVGADSYLNATTINHYLQAERLQVPGNADGFIPGEAAAVLLLQRQESGTALPALRIAGSASGQEPGRPDGSVPSRAQGLTTALRAALAQSRHDYTAMQFRMGDQNGEAFFARDAANALARLAPVGGAKLPLLTLADCLGEIGAATGPAMLAYLGQVMPRSAGPGALGLLHLANDDGLRCALVLEFSPT